MSKVVLLTMCEFQFLKGVFFNCFFPVSFFRGVFSGFFLSLFFFFFASQT